MESTAAAVIPISFCCASTTERRTPSREKDAVKYSCPSPGNACVSHAG